MILIFCMCKKISKTLFRLSYPYNGSNFIISEKYYHFKLTSELFIFWEFIKGLKCETYYENYYV